MKIHKEIDDNPPNSFESVLEAVESEFEPKHGKNMPELLFEFITLLGKEKKEWGGVKAMRECLKEFRRWEKKSQELDQKKKSQELNDNHATCEDFEFFLFSLDRNVIVIQGDEGPMTSKAVIQGVVDPPANRETGKEIDRPSSSKTVNPDLPKASNNLKGTDNPSTTKKEVIPATNIKNKLKVKIYMGTGWDKDFPKHDRGSSPRLFVNVLTKHGGQIQKTKVDKSSTWGKQIGFPLTSLESDELVVEVYPHTQKFKDKFAYTSRLLVSNLKPGIQVIPLSFKVGNKRSTARLLIRFMFI
ncbi:hypothetical protein N665_0127s0016 [Sinapis alba]|nr:hypothetical protein N665_0127s0016 [Sinapis alba]